MIKIPLKKGKSKKTIEANFHNEHKKHPNMPQKQLVAMVLSTANPKGKAKAKKKPRIGGAV